MVDIFSKEKRSEIMKKVSPSGNKSTELRMIELFKANHVVGWRRNYNLIGKPDFVFSKKRVAVFIDGCFWHGHNCRNLRPSSNAEYWKNKQEYNKKHDKQITHELIKKNWKVYRFWECQIKKNQIHLNVKEFIDLMK
jgi:DNA mismatch endonuclease (patch repair protein)